MDRLVDGDSLHACPAEEQPDRGSGILRRLRPARGRRCEPGLPERHRDQRVLRLVLGPDERGQIGDEYLDRVFLIKGTSREFVQNFFTESIMARLKSVFVANPYSIEVTGKHISFVRTDEILDSSYYKDAIDLVMELKDTLSG